MPIKLHDFVEAMIKLQIDDGIRELIRNRVINGEYSRNAYDVAILLHYYGNSYRIYKNEKDLKAYKKVFQDLKFMSVQDLRSQHLDYLVRGLSAGTPIIMAEEDKTNQ